MVGRGFVKREEAAMSWVRVPFEVRMFWNWIEVVIAQPWDCTKCYRTRQFNRLDFM